MQAPLKQGISVSTPTCQEDPVASNRHFLQMLCTYVMRQSPTAYMQRRGPFRCEIIGRFQIRKSVLHPNEKETRSIIYNLMLDLTCIQMVPVIYRVVYMLIIPI